jgi:hypothetical protein
MGFRPAACVRRVDAARLLAFRGMPM